MGVMRENARHARIEPLFASNARLWLRVWGLTQATALVVSCFVIVNMAGSMRAFLAGPNALSTIVVVVLLVAYHAVGLLAYERIMRRRWAAVLFVPVGWAIALTSAQIAGVFGLLMIGVVIQGCIFLPFAWAMGALTLIVTSLVAMTFAQAGVRDAAFVVSRAWGLLAVGVTVGTVLLYIHRVNVDSAARARLLQQLDEAQRDLAVRAREAGVQDERQRLALEIHDTLAQGFASVIRHLEAIELSFSAGDGAELTQRATPHLANAQAVSRSSLAEIRRLVWALRPPDLADSTIGAAIERIVAAWSASNGVRTTCKVDALPPMSPDADVIFLRAAQEALSNVARHAHATEVGVALQCEDGLALLSVEDNGCGFANSDVAGQGRFGIVGMRERVARFGGYVMVDSVAGEGTSVTVAMPLSAITREPQ
jgi:signal transduction histidine kinase